MGSRHGHNYAVVVRDAELDAGDTRLAAVGDLQLERDAGFGGDVFLDQQRREPRARPLKEKAPGKLYAVRRALLPHVVLPPGTGVYDVYHRPIDRVDPNRSGTYPSYLPQMREDHVRSAVAFLQEPQVASAPLNKRVEFLESKGLTSEEINAALQRVDESAPAGSESSTGSETTARSGTSSSSVQRGPQAPPVPMYMLQQPPPVPRRDWKDYFVMATVSVGVAYGLYECAKRYVLPALMPPTPAVLEADKEALEQEFQRTEQLLEQLQQDTAELKQQEAQRSENFDRFMTEAHDVIRDIKEHAEDRKQEAKLALANIETLRDSIPRTLEKHSETAASAIADLQNELKSLKQLVSRSKNAPGVPIPPASAVPTSLPGFPRKSKDPKDPKEPKEPKEAKDSRDSEEPFVPNPAGSTKPAHTASPQTTGSETASPEASSPANPADHKASIPEWQRALS